MSFSGLSSLAKSGYFWVLSFDGAWQNPHFTPSDSLKLSITLSRSSLLIFVYAFMQFIFAPVLGNLSDQYGRRPVLLIALFGFGVDYLFLALAPTFGWLFIGRIISGITGASFTTASAYIADISTAETR